MAHAYNLSPYNYSDVVSASTITELAYLIGGVGSPDPTYDVPRDVYISDWSIEDLAKLLFLETATDIAVVHNLPLYCYTDGMVSLEKTAEAVDRYPVRFRAYAGIDPLRGAARLSPRGAPPGWSQTTRGTPAPAHPEPISERAPAAGVHCDTWDLAEGADGRRGGRGAGRRRSQRTP